MNFFQNNKLLLIGAVLGTAAGLLYYYYIGCDNGSCSITSKPLNSSAYGAILGGLFLSSFESKKKNQDHVS